MTNTTKELAEEISSLTIDELQELETEYGIIITIAQTNDSDGGIPNPGGPGH